MLTLYWIKCFEVVSLRRVKGRISVETERRFEINVRLDDNDFAAEESSFIYIRSLPHSMLCRYD
jgi:hypothetical protein